MYLGRRVLYRLFFFFLISIQSLDTNDLMIQKSGAQKPCDRWEKYLTYFSIGLTGVLVGVVCACLKTQSGNSNKNLLQRGTHRCNNNSIEPVFDPTSPELLYQRRATNESYGSEPQLPKKRNVGAAKSKLQVLDPSYLQSDSFVGSSQCLSFEPPPPYSAECSIDESNDSNYKFPVPSNINAVPSNTNANDDDDSRSHVANSYGNVTDLSFFDIPDSLPATRKRDKKRKKKKRQPRKIEEEEDVEAAQSRQKKKEKTLTSRRNSQEFVRDTRSQKTKVKRSSQYLSGSGY